MQIDNWFLIIIAFFLGVNIFNAIKMRQATELLNDGQKALLFRLFSSLRIYTLLFLSIIIIAYMYLANQSQDQYISIMYFACLFLSMLVIMLLSVRKLKQNGYPSAYIRTYLMVNLLRNIALLAMLAYLLLLMNPSRY
ncbi:MAG: hypothetical protein KJS92_09035 [Bacteroidetes bacterium]|nr:hypothetical protein [Bacteroidota bacterium]